MMHLAHLAARFIHPPMECLHKTSKDMGTQRDQANQSPDI